jgi:hypothetical protein
VGNLKQKYDAYDTLQHDERIYLREIVHQMLCHKADIGDYLEIALLASQASLMQTPYLF